MRQDQGCQKEHGIRDRAQEREQEQEPMELQGTVVRQELHQLGLQGRVLLDPVVFGSKAGSG